MFPNCSIDTYGLNQNSWQDGGGKKMYKDLGDEVHKITMERFSQPSGSGQSCSFVTVPKGH